MFILLRSLQRSITHFDTRSISHVRSQPPFEEGNVETNLLERIQKNLAFTRVKRFENPNAEFLNLHDGVVFSHQEALSSINKRVYVSLWSRVPGILSQFHENVFNFNMISSRYFRLLSLIP